MAADPPTLSTEQRRTRILALVEENTERRRLDQIRRDFVANISHELRTPVGALGLLAETIQDEPDIETVRRLAGRMVAESDRVADTIEDLLELSRIEFGDETHIDELDVDAVVAEATSRLAAAAEQRQVTLRRTGAPSCIIAGDRRQLVSAVYNLVDNACKYADDATDRRIVLRNSVDGGRGRVFVQNGEEHTHGLTAPDLGFGAWRNSSILASITGREVYAIERRIAFQDFGVPAEVRETATAVGVTR